LVGQLGRIINLYREGSIQPPLIAVPNCKKTQFKNFQYADRYLEKHKLETGLTIYASKSYSSIMIPRTLEKKLIETLTEGPYSKPAI